MNTKPFNFVKFATDLTPRKDQNKQLAYNFETNVKSLVEIVASSSLEMQNNANDLSNHSDELQTIVDDFLNNIRNM